MVQDTASATTSFAHEQSVGIAVPSADLHMQSEAEPEALAASPDVSCPLQGDTLLSSDDERQDHYDAPNKKVAKYVQTNVVYQSKASQTIRRRSCNKCWDRKTTTRSTKTALEGDCNEFSGNWKQ